jgi:predicted DNA binding CopG/RHH family protein
MKKDELDRDERAILDAFERGELRPVKNPAAAIARHRKYAQNTLRKDRRVNIRISDKDLEGLRVMAVEDGIPYQTLMSSVLHRFVSGSLVPSPRR